MYRSATRLERTDAGKLSDAREKSWGRSGGGECVERKMYPSGRIGGILVFEGFFVRGRMVRWGFAPARNVGNAWDWYELSVGSQSCRDYLNYFFRKCTGVGESAISGFRILFWLSLQKAKSRCHGEH